MDRTHWESFWVRVRGREKRDTLGIKFLKLSLVFCIIMMICICQVWRINYVLVNNLVSLMTNFIIFRYLLCESPYVPGTRMPGGASCQHCLKPSLLKTQKTCPCSGTWPYWKELADCY